MHSPRLWGAKVILRRWRVGLTERKTFRRPKKSVMLDAVSDTGSCQGLASRRLTSLDQMQLSLISSSSQQGGLQNPDGRQSLFAQGVNEYHSPC